MNLRLYPDFERDTVSGKVRSRSRNPLNPVFEIDISKGGESVKSGYLSADEGITFNGYTLELKSLSWWAQLDVSRDKGVPFIFIGFIALVAGLVIRLMLSEKALWIIIKEREIGFGGKCSYFPRLFHDELKQIVSECSAMLEQSKQVERDVLPPCCRCDPIAWSFRRP